MHSDSTLRQRQRDAASADAEFEHAAALRKWRKEIDCRGCIVAHALVDAVVNLGDALAVGGFVVVRHVATKSNCHGQRQLT